MGHVSKRSWAAIASLGFVLAAGGAAAAPSRTAEPTPEGQKAEPLISVHFPGGTVREYAAMLREATRPSPANIALSEAAGQTKLPAVDLDSVTLGTAVYALQIIATSSQYDNWQVQQLSSDPPAYAVTVFRTAIPDDQRSGGGQPDRMLQVFSIKELIDPPTPGTPTPETVLSAVDLALRMAGTSADEPPALKFHPESGLLILDAPPQQVGAIESLLSRMRNDVFRQRDQVQDAARQRLDFETALQVAQVKAENAAARTGFAKQALDQMQALQQTGGASAGDLRQAQMEFMDSKNQNDMAAIELRAAKARLDGLGERPAAEGPGSGETGALREEVQRLRQQVATLEAKIKELEGRRK
jgi:hypothetical protein